MKYHRVSLLLYKLYNAEILQLHKTYNIKEKWLLMERHHILLWSHTNTFQFEQYGENMK